jgi:acetylornithine/succinyldiaminopimelate/putrescine aminotransferase
MLKIKRYSHEKKHSIRRDIKRLRSKAEQDYVQALVRFHNRNIEGLRTAIKQRKRVQANKKQKNIVTKKNSFHALGSQRNCKQKQCNEKGSMN